MLQALARLMLTQDLGKRGDRVPQPPIQLRIAQPRSSRGRKMIVNWETEGSQIEVRNLRVRHLRSSEEGEFAVDGGGTGRTAKGKNFFRHELGVSDFEFRVSDFEFPHRSLPKMFRQIFQLIRLGLGLHATNRLPLQLNQFLDAFLA